MHDHMINYYCYCRPYFIVCVLKVITFIISSIQSIIFGNIKVVAALCSE